MTRIAAGTPNPSSVIEEASRNGACERTYDHEPPAADELLDEERHHTGDQPGDATPAAAPERDQHGGKEDRHHEIDAVATRIGDQRPREITDGDRAHPGERRNGTRAKEHAGIRATS